VWVRETGWGILLFHALFQVAVGVQVQEVLLVVVVVKLLRSSFVFCVVLVKVGSAVCVCCMLGWAMVEV
jgi:hypothetical protein